MEVRKVSETSSVIQIEWDEVVGQEGFIPTIDGSDKLTDGKRHPSTSKTLTTVKIGKPQDGKPHAYGVRILGTTASGEITSPAPPPVGLTVVDTVQDEKTITGPTFWEAIPSEVVDKVEFFVDEKLVSTENYPPYVCMGDGNMWSPTIADNGYRTLKSVATKGTKTAEAISKVLVNISVPPPPPAAKGAGRVRTYPDMSGGWLDASARNSADHTAWLAKLDRVLSYGNYSNLQSWFPRAHEYLDTYANYRSGGPGSPPSRLPETVLKDANGNYVYIDWRESDGSYRQYAADVANPLWMNDYLSRCKQALNAGAKGIYLDDFNLHFSFNNGSGSVTPIDPRTGQLMTRDNWANYMTTFGEWLSERLPGVELCFNTVWYAIAGHDGSDQYFQRLSKLPNAIISYERGFNDPGLHNNTDVKDEWSFGRYMQHMDNVHKNGAKIYLRSGGKASTKKDAMFNLCCSLLVSAAGDYQGCYYGMLPSQWDSMHDTDLGDDKGSRYASGTNKLKRDFTLGSVEVDFPTRTGVITKV